MLITVVLADPKAPQRQQLELAEGGTVEDAITGSKLLTRFPMIDLNSHKIGIFGKMAKLNQTLAEGDRVELYLPITADPKAVKKRTKSENSSNRTV